jgi:hypothetical protein
MQTRNEKRMALVLHVFSAAFHWLLPHLATVGISTAVTATGGGIMWALGFRKAKLSNQKLSLEIEHLRIDTQRIDLEVQRLAEEKTQRDAAKNVAVLSDRIIELAKECTKKNPTFGSSAPFSEEQLCSELKESQESIAKAIQTLKAQGRASYRGQTQTWIIKV